ILNLDLTKSPARYIQEAKLPDEATSRPNLSGVHHLKHIAGRCADAQELWTERHDGLCRTHKVLDLWQLFAKTRHSRSQPWIQAEVRRLEGVDLSDCSVKEPLQLGEVVGNLLPVIGCDATRVVAEGVFQLRGKRQ